MEKVKQQIKEEIHMMDNGNLIKDVDKVQLNLLQDKLMKEIGK